MIMKFFQKVFSTAVIIAVILLMSIMPTSAQSAEVGDTVVIRTYISNHSNMASLTMRLNYDENAFDYLSSDGYNFLSTANTEVKGEVTWAAIFSMFGGKDFTEKTEVMSITLIAKSSVANVEELISNTIIEAYDGDLIQVNDLSVSVEAEVYSANADNVGDTSSKTEFIVSRYDDVISNETDSLAVSSFAESDVSESSSDNEISPNDTANKSERASSLAESEKFELFEESSLTGSHLIHTNDTAESNTDKSVGTAYLVSAAIGAAAVIIIAVILVIVKRRSVNSRASHMK